MPANPTTTLLATEFGGYLVAAGIFGLTKRENWTSVLLELRDRTGLAYIVGAFVYCLGVAIIAVHNSWDSLLEVVVSLVGWAALIEGLILLAAPAWFLSIVGPAVDHLPVRTISAAVVVLGVSLIVLGRWG